MDLRLKFAAQLVKKRDKLVENFLDNEVGSLLDKACLPSPKGIVLCNQLRALDPAFGFQHLTAKPRNPRYAQIRRPV